MRDQGIFHFQIHAHALRQKSTERSDSATKNGTGQMRIHSRPILLRSCLTFESERGLPKLLDTSSLKLGSTNEEGCWEVVVRSFTTDSIGVGNEHR